MDGTLADSMGLWSDIDYRFFKERGIELPDDYQNKISHMAFMDMARYTRDRFSLKESPEEIASIWLDMAKVMYADDVKLKLYAKELLSKLKSEGYKISLATSTKRILFEDCLKNNGIDKFFDHTISVEDVGYNKSNPAIYLKACELMNSKPYETLVFEDILTALKTAKCAGLKTCAVYEKCSDCDREEIEKTANYYINSFDELF